jgi:protein TonB
MAGIALAAGAGTAAWFALQNQPSGGAPATEASIASVPATVNQDLQKIDLLLEKARAASDAGQLFEPRGNSAFDFYQKALELDPDNPSAAAGLDLLLVTTVENAKRSMAEGELDMAQQALGRAAMVDPTDGYLLSAQQELADAVNAKMEATIAAQQLQQPDNSLDAVEAGSDSMAKASEPSAQQSVTAPTSSSTATAEPAETLLPTLSTPELLSRARTDLQHNTADSRDEALLALEQVLEREPTNGDAESMLDALLSQYLEVARVQTDKGNFQNARRAMDSARRIDPEAQLGSDIGGVTELLATGKAYEQEGKYQAAVKTYLEALLIEPDSPQIDASLHGVHQLYVSAIEQHLADQELEQAAELQAEALTWFPNSEALQQLIASPEPAARTVEE